MDRFNPPGMVNDFGRRPRRRAALAKGWSSVVNYWIAGEARRAAQTGGRFYNPLTDGPADPRDHAPIGWEAFPLLLTKWFGTEAENRLKRWKVAEIPRPWPYGYRVRRGRQELVTVLRRQQDEYCEWFVRRQPGKRRIERIDFTCEGPEYWMFLAHGTHVLFRGVDDGPPPVDGDLSLVLDLYREHIDESIALDDLVWQDDILQPGYSGDLVVAHKAGEYNPFNKWNTTHGAMHLTHPANTLGAEIRLASDATVVRARGATVIESADELICCAGYGDPNRSSDPIIGGGVNGLARLGRTVSLADPIGLYISELDHDAFSGPNGEDVSDAWVTSRGTAGSGQRPGRILRASFGRSAAADLDVGEIRTRNRRIQYGGQVADAIQMVLFGESKPTRGRKPPSQQCELTCCTDPTGRPVKEIVQLGGDCGRVDWKRLAPYGGKPGRGAIADAAFATREVTVPSFAPFGSGARGRVTR